MAVSPAGAAVIRAGRKNRRIRIVRPSGAVDALNQPLGTVTVVRETWAEPRGLSGLGAIREQNGGLPIPITRYSFRVSYRAGIDVTSEMKLIELVNGVEGNRFNITGTLVDMSNREWVDIVCELGNG